MPLYPVTPVLFAAACAFNAVDASEIGEGHALPNSSCAWIDEVLLACAWAQENGKHFATEFAVWRLMHRLVEVELLTNRSELQKGQ